MTLFSRGIVFYILSCLYDGNKGGTKRPLGLCLYYTGGRPVSVDRGFVGNGYSVFHPGL